VLRAIHNLANDKRNHKYILSEEIGLWGHVLTPIIGSKDEGIDDEDRAKMDPLVIKVMTKEKKRDPDADVRKAVIDIVYALVRKTRARRYLKKTNVYQIMRELHNYERDVAKNEELDYFFDTDLIQWFIMDDDAVLTDGELEEEKEEEERKKLAVSKLEQNSNTESKSITPAVTAPVKAKAIPAAAVEDYDD
jgi:hypothetical protein